MILSRPNVAIRLGALLVLVLCQWLLSPATAQITSTKGREFWLAFQQNNLNTGTGGECLRRFYISADRTTSGYYLTRTGSRVDITVNAGTTRAIDVDLGVDGAFDAEVESNLLAESDKAIYINMADSVSVFLLNWERNSSDATVVLPVQNLGNEYYVMSLPNQSNLQRSQALVLAVDNNTQIEYQRPGGTPQTVTLQRGQTFQIQATGGIGDDLTGMRIRSLGTCKRFAVFSGTGARALCVGTDTTINGLALEARVGTGVAGPGCTGSNHLVEQLAPVTTWGKRFLLVPFLIRQVNYIRIVAKDNNTQVRVNGTLQRTLNSGEFHSVLIRDVTVVETSEPVQVAQFCQSLSVELGAGTGDPYMIMVSPLEQTINSVTFDAFPPAGIPMRFFVNIVTRASSTGTVRLDGTLIPSGSFTTVPRLPDYAFARLEIGEGQHRVSSDSNIVVYVYGLGNNTVSGSTFEGYGYSGGARLENLTLQLRTALPFPICSGLSNTYEAQTTIPTDLFRWDFGNGDIRTGRTVSYTYPRAGTYNLILTAQRSASCLVDTLRRTLIVTGERLLLNNDTNVCQNDQFILRTRPSTATFAWSATGGTLSASAGVNPRYTATTPGRSRITLISRLPDGCVYEDTMSVVVAIPPVISAPGRDTSVCQFTSLNFVSSRNVTWRLRRAGVVTTIASATRNATISFPRVGRDTVEALADGCVTRRIVTAFAAASINAPTTADNYTICQQERAVFTSTIPGRWFRRRGTTVTELAANADRVPAQQFNTPGTEFIIVESCGLRDSVRVTVNPRPAISPNLADTSFCAFTNLQVQAIVPSLWRLRLPGGAVQTLNGGAIQTNSGVINAPLGTSFLISEAAGCRDTIRFVTVVTPPRFITPTRDTVVCTGTRLTMTATDIGYWYRKRGSSRTTLDSLTNRITNVPFDVPGTDTILLANCGTIERRVIRVVPPLAVTAAVSPDVCNLARGKVLLTVTGGQAPYTYQWTGSALTTGPSPSPTNRINTGYLRAGEARVVVRDAIGCEAIVTSIIPNLDPPTLTATTDPVLRATRIIPDATITGTASSDRGVSFQWDMNNGTLLNTANIRYTYTQSRTQPTPTQPNPPPDSFLIKASVSDTAGCTTTKELGYFTVLTQPILIVPNVFTPNNDGTNDRLVVTTVNEGVRSFRIWVYDRSGRQLFASTALNSSWDGKVNGTDVAAGVYFYRVEVTYLNGRSVDRTGTVTLLR